MCIINTERTAHGRVWVLRGKVCLQFSHLMKIFVQSFIQIGVLPKRKTEGISKIYNNSSVAYHNPMCPRRIWYWSVHNQKVENCPLQILQETYISDVYNSEWGPATGFHPFLDCRNGKDVLYNFAVGGNKYIGWAYTPNKKFQICCQSFWELKIEWKWAVSKFWMQEVMSCLLCASEIETQNKVLLVVIQSDSQPAVQQTYRW